MSRKRPKFNENEGPSLPFDQRIGETTTDIHSLGRFTNPDGETLIVVLVSGLIVQNPYIYRPTW